MQPRFFLEFPSVFFYLALNICNSSNGPVFEVSISHLNVELLCIKRGKPERESSVNEAMKA